ncbi:MAG: ABC transporter ATP-binding protein [Alphaproteobacteria bacterium]|nr:ABC transporter ATP-binding protein [Alphaproteobacteria bacterium]MBU0795888.1 ABC transporter ATP-binding protein [Alphaproteobacteria bacterium]MBU0887207.1 ABC transporter ATP-binding protein [Alphaproteobacteria bacterium]MBU1812265.1 ABC transporter ATP-binding protein [Alphaproteobacteria bacterium]
MTALLEARDLTIALDDRPVVQQAGLALAAGDFVGLLGPNGAGKTTLLRALAGLLLPQFGSVRLDGQPLTALPAADRARRLAYLPQGAECHWPLSVAALVALGRLPHRAPWAALSPVDIAAIDAAMAFTDVRHLADRPVTRLSGGERARVLLARALAVDPAILLADEPVAGLDPGHQLDVMALLAARAQAGGAVLVVLHDLTLAARFCRRLVLLQAGRILADGPPEAVLTPANLRAAYGIDAHISHTDEGLLVVPGRRL